MCARARVCVCVCGGGRVRTILAENGVYDSNFDIYAGCISQRSNFVKTLPAIADCDA